MSKRGVVWWGYQAYSCAYTVVTLMKLTMGEKVESWTEWGSVQRNEGMSFGLHGLAKRERGPDSSQPQAVPCLHVCRQGSLKLPHSLSI
jgi:hypothetical protein